VPALLDTGALELLRRRDRRVETLALRLYPPLICPQVAGEFLYGQRHAKVSIATLDEARGFLESFEMLPTSTDTAETYAFLRAGLTAKGIALPDPDYWIAAHALEENLPLITTDRDFRHMPGLNVHYILSNPNPP
jgi:predicted nucleic acid-binding protein